MNSTKKILLALSIAVAVVAVGINVCHNDKSLRSAAKSVGITEFNSAFGPSDAEAQAMGPYNKRSTSVVGHIVPVFNASDSVIFDGELVNMDTTTATSFNQRIYVRRYIPAAAARQHTLGLAVGRIAKSSQGGSGQVLIQGYHPNARVGVTGVAAYAPLKVSTITTGSLAAGDTVAANCGFLIKYVAGGAPFKAAVWFYGGGKCAGPAL